MILGSRRGREGRLSDVLEKHWAFAAIEQAHADGSDDGDLLDDAVTGVRQFSPRAPQHGGVAEHADPRPLAGGGGVRPWSSGSWYAGAAAVQSTTACWMGVEDAPGRGPDPKCHERWSSGMCWRSRAWPCRMRRPCGIPRPRSGTGPQIPRDIRVRGGGQWLWASLWYGQQRHFAGGATFTRAQAAAVYGRLEGVFTVGGGSPPRETTPPEAEDPVAAVVRLVNEVRPRRACPAGGPLRTGRQG